MARFFGFGETVQLVHSSPKIIFGKCIHINMDLIESMDSSSIRVDKSSKTGSVKDVIRMVLGCSSSAAATTLSRLFVASEAMVTRCDNIRIQGKGKPTPCADAKTLMEIVWLLPGKKAHAFRRQSSEKVCRLLGGDLSLVSEIEARHTSLQSTEEGRATQAFLLNGREEEAVETFQGMPPAFKYIDSKDRGDMAKRLIEQQLQESTVALKRQRVDNLINSYRSLQDIGVHLDGRTLIELRDSVTILSRQDVVINDAVAVATPLLQDSSTPTHELDAAQRGRETGIVVVSAKIGLRVPQHLSGAVGKLMKKLYIKKYRLSSNFKAFVKRETMFNGRPGLENTYYARDEDIIEQAIREVMTAGVGGR